MVVAQNDRFAVVEKTEPARAHRGREDPRASAGRARPQRARAPRGRGGAPARRSGQADDRPLPLLARGAPQTDCEVLEVGAGRGHSTIWFAAGVRYLGGRVVSLERDPEVAADWRANVAEAGLEEWAELIEGDALETLAALEDVFDVVFLDAKKDEYERYFELVRPPGRPRRPGRRRQRPLARGSARRLQPRAPERPHARERHRPARQRARADVRARALAGFAPHSSGSTSRRPARTTTGAPRGPRCRSGGRRTACPGSSAWMGAPASTARARGGRRRPST